MEATTYRPENVRIIERTDSPYGAACKFLLVDHDGHELQWFRNYSDAAAAQRSRQGVIRAALTRRANKARR